jgi:Uma2 family endonuclease
MSTITINPVISPPFRATGPRLLTAADLAAMPTRLPSGDVKFELDDGRLVVMAPPGDIHGRQQARWITVLMTHGEDRGHGQVRGEVGVILRRNPDRVAGPDVAFVASKSLPVRLSSEGYLETIPELIVEVRSPNDTGPEVLRKAAEYLAAGVQLVWVADPESQTVTAYTSANPPQVFSASDSLTADPVIPGFVVPVADLFRA